jgi:hypothetical protein
MRRSARRRRDCRAPPQSYKHRERCSHNFALGVAGDGRTLQQSIDEIQRSAQVGRRRENAQMGDGSHEVSDTEPRQPPRTIAFGKHAEPPERFSVTLGLAPMGIDQYVSVDRAQSRSIKSLSALRSAISTAGGALPWRIGSSSVNLLRPRGRGNRRALSASSARNQRQSLSSPCLRALRAGTSA